MEAEVYLGHRICFGEREQILDKCGHIQLEDVELSFDRIQFP